ncbi:polysaccharide deacetylase family protein [Mucilaginibacter sp. FT3.2]|uniref:polysaccharide deacetylase family protein n=1 Tax=Mucilaginibacter sp. FT3.2 TaxID=2723090 RepID=UPI00161945D2|nr:polysaccharide deacetylase family protein [Mucilaginibacter sp. FT3.2]MBB6229668.1 sialate O-acetylesterase [Mucilaginibacter sp. FT3.2]
MKRIIVFLLLLNFTAYAQQHKKAIIVLTYDDALESQLDVALPQLDSLGFKATFFLMGNIGQATIPRWRQVALKGHELANHSLYHPCLLTTVKANQANNSGSYTVYMMLREIAEMNNLLFAVDGQTAPRTYAYPCTEVAVGSVNYVDSLRLAGTIKYARIGGGPDAVITDFKKLDVLQIPAWGVHAGVTGDELIAFAKKVQQSGGMGVFMFHGVGGDYITTPAAAHRQLLLYLKQHQDEIEVCTFKTGMDRVAAAGHN